jgi:hypothetical protein
MYNRNKYCTIIYDPIETIDFFESLIIFVIKITYSNIEVFKQKGVIYFTTRVPFSEIQRKFSLYFPKTKIYTGKLTRKELKDELENNFRI